LPCSRVLAACGTHFVSPVKPDRAERYGGPSRDAIAGEVAPLGLSGELERVPKKLRASESVTISRTGSASALVIGEVSPWFHSSSPCFRADSAGTSRVHPSKVTTVPSS
jgi:hypothetical protein